MTPRERAYALVDWVNGDRAYRGGSDALVDAIERVIAEAVETEREACAWIADAGCHCDDAPEHIAEAIRARGTR